MSRCLSVITKSRKPSQTGWLEMWYALHSWWNWYIIINVIFSFKPEIVLFSGWNFYMFWLKPVLVAGAVLEGVLWRYRIWSCCTTKQLNAKQKGTLLVWMYTRSLQTWRGNSSSTVNHFKHAVAKMSSMWIFLQRDANSGSPSHRLPSGIPHLLL